MKLTKLFTEFFESEKSAGLILIFCIATSLLLANSTFGQDYIHLWHINIFSKPIEFWIGDGLMTIFFLLIGLEIEREIFIGELSNIRKSLLPIVAAIGGMLVPAFLHFSFNHGKITQGGFGIPMATDIAFSLGILSLLGKRVSASLKVFLIALAIIDDLGAIIVIAIFYNKGFSVGYFALAMILFALMMVLNRSKLHKIWVYLILGCGMWFFMYRSGIHATITGVLLAFAVPFGSGNEKSPSYKLQHYLHKPVAFLIMPIFAFANTALVIPSSFSNDLMSLNSLGIILGLLIGKPLGIFLFSVLGAAIGVCSFPADFKKKHLLGVGLLAGIGFTMSIFIAVLAFSDKAIIASSKIAILFVSVMAGLVGFFWLQLTLPQQKKIMPANE